jgi:hypothetical protein
MAAATLVGVGLKPAYGMVVGRVVAALALLVFIVREAMEAVEAARGGEAESDEHYP